MGGDAGAAVYAEQVGEGFDVIGDVHGFADPLERLLVGLGYEEIDGTYRHERRRAVFVGDLIDRGPDQLRTVGIVRSMVDHGSALMVLGNHEFNGVAWSTPDGAGGWCRPHTDKNRRQHSAFLDAVGENSAEHDEWIQWFYTVPMWIDLGDLRVVHACWDPASMDVMGDGVLYHEIVAASEGSPVFEALENVLKGPEIDMGGPTYLDPGGHCRDVARIRWWDPSVRTLADAVEIPNGSTACDGSPFGPVADVPLDNTAVPDVPRDVPILYGHYWRSGDDPSIDNSASACLDWSVAGGGPLVAYRWSGESELTNSNLVWVEGL